MKNDIDIVGKQVRNLYGAPIGKAIGTIVDIDGSIQLVGVYGPEGLKQIPFEQMVFQNGVVIFIPQWRLDSQRILREKNMLLRRLRALAEIVSENDEMKQDAEGAYEKYKAKISSLGEEQKSVRAMLEARLEELDREMKMVNMLIFDSRVQLKSNEISRATFESVKTEANSIMEYITNENAEIVNVQRRIEDLDMEVSHAIEPPKPKTQYANPYLDSEEEIESKLPKAPTDPIGAEPVEVSAAPQVGRYLADMPEGTGFGPESAMAGGADTLPRLPAHETPHDAPSHEPHAGDELPSPQVPEAQHEAPANDKLPETPANSGPPEIPVNEPEEPPVQETSPSPQGQEAELSSPVARPDWLSRMATQ